MSPPSALSQRAAAKDAEAVHAPFEGRPISFRETWRVIPLPRERSLVVTLLRHWASLTAPSDLPSIDRLDPQALPIDWRNCVLLRRNGSDDWHFEYQGEAFVDFGHPPTQARHSLTPDARLSEWIDMARGSARPVTAGGAFQHGSGQRVRFRTLLLPFGDDGGRVTHLLAASTAHDLLSLEPRHLPIEAYAYVDGFWIRQALAG